MSEPGLIGRLARIEEELRALGAELEEVRRLVGAAEEPPEDSVVEVPVGPVRPVARAWRALERGREREALALGAEALEAALREGDDRLRREVAAFAAEAASVVEPHLLPEALELAGRAAATPPEAVTPAAAPAAPGPAAPAEAPAIDEPAGGGRARARLELSDARLFALVGGLVTLLGVVFLFVLAANRGWIGPAARVAIGAVASAAVFAAGVGLRLRFGRLQASLAAAGTGVAGAYATLAAATVVYGFLPDWAALLLAAAIAASGGGLALAWSSQLLAGLSLVGAATAPGLVALDQGIGAAGTAFAVVVFAVALAAAAPRRWLWLALAVGASTLAQVAWLVAASPAEDGGALAVVVAGSLVLLAGSLVWQAAAAGALDQAAASFALAGGGLAFGGLAALLPGDRDAGMALAAAAVVYAAVAAAGLRRMPALARVIGAVAVMLAGIATAYLLSERSLTVAWAVEAAVLAALARRLLSPRFELGALAYLAVGVGHLLAVDVWLDRPAGDLPQSAAVGDFALAAAAATVGACALGPAHAPGADRPPFAAFWRQLVAARGLVRLWVWGAAAALLWAATAALLSGRSLTVAFAAEAAGFAVVAWASAGAPLAFERRFELAPRFALAALVYLAGGIVHAFAVDLSGSRPVHDLPASAAPGLFALAVAALTAGVLALGRLEGTPPGHPSRASLWDRLLDARGWLRLPLWSAAVALASLATAALLSGRWLTMVWLAAAAALASAASLLGERRLQAAALALLAVASVHALAVDAQPHTLLLARGQDALAAVPSLAALAVTSLALARLAVFADRGIAFLGPLEGGEETLGLLAVHARAVRGGLALGAAGFALWAAGLLLISASYEPGQTAATGLWAAAAVGLAAVAARRRSPPPALLAALPAGFAYGKAVGFDWHELADGWAAAALLLAAAGVLLLGFFGRYAAEAARWPLQWPAAATATLAACSALVAVDRVAPERIRVAGAAALAVALALAALAVPPYRSRRRGDGRRWLRDFTSVYWILALLATGYGEAAVLDGFTAATVTAWALTGALVATTARPLLEERLWLAGAAGTDAATLACLAAVTPPSRLVVSSLHPGAGLWALAACIAALAWASRVAPAPCRRLALTLSIAAVALALGALSLGILEAAERLSGASIQTDFQRGHTAVSAVWGALALTLFVAGLSRRSSILQRTGLALFGLALAKLFLYDLASLSSITRALSFLAVGAILLTAAFFAERLIHGDGPGSPPGPRPAH